MLIQAAIANPVGRYLCRKSGWMGGQDYFADSRYDAVPAGWERYFIDIVELAKTVEEKKRGKLGNRTPEPGSG